MELLQLRSEAETQQGAHYLPTKCVNVYKLHYREQNSVDCLLCGKAFYLHNRILLQYKDTEAKQNVIFCANSLQLNIVFGGGNVFICLQFDKIRRKLHCEWGFYICWFGLELLQNCSVCNFLKSLDCLAYQEFSNMLRCSFNPVIMPFRWHGWCFPLRSEKDAPAVPKQIMFKQIVELHMGK